MNEPRLCGRLLAQLFRNGQTGVNADIIDVARSCEASVLAVLKASVILERAGLVDARRLRLTLPGLAVAAAFAQPGAEAPAGRQPARSPSRARHAA
jgi:hypothetical protein